jgi:hypothetical protein
MDLLREENLSALDDDPLGLKKQDSLWQKSRITSQRLAKDEELTRLKKTLLMVTIQ